MPAISNAQADIAPDIGEKIRPSMPWRVVTVTPMDDYKLRVRFVDGLEGEVHMAPLLTSSEAGVFAPLRGPAFFSKVGLSRGAVTWPGGLDLAPDAMYDDIKSTGICIVGP